MAKKYNYYAVKRGLALGIYTEWKECQRQIIRFPNACFKGFATLEEAEAYLKGDSLISNITVEKDVILPRTPERKHCDIYTDGSYENGRYSWAFAVYEDNRLTHSMSAEGLDRESAKMQNVAGEIEAVTNAVQWAEDKNIYITIHHDYTGVAEWALGAWRAKNKWTQRYIEFIRPRLGWIKFNKVKAHTGIEGNELADKLAGEVLKVYKVV